MGSAKRKTIMFLGAFWPVFSVIFLFTIGVKLNFL